MLTELCVSLPDAIVSLSTLVAPWLSTGSLSLTALDKHFQRDGPEDVAPVLVQEGAGFHLSISKDLKSASHHAASMIKEKYDTWLKGGWRNGETGYKHHYFTIAVGGGNTVKSEFADLLKHHALDIDWIEHIRFYFLEESSGEKNWESSHDSLVDCLIEPLMDRLIERYGRRLVAMQLHLNPYSDVKDILQKLIEILTYSYDLSEVTKALKAGEKERAEKLAQKEAKRYQNGVKDRLGSSMAFHLIISGIAKDGGVGAFATYTPQLREKKPGLVVLKQDNGAIRIALNRGVFINAECISLVVSGSLKLKALGRFEMEEIVNFEKTVMETPLRMLRETREIAEKVHIFADDRALHFDESVFKHRENGKQIETKAEVREGIEDDGIHILLIHGFMGLYSYINFLIRLPSAWKVSAMHRGRHANRLPDEAVFPHHADVLKRAILRNWRSGLPTPTGFHSIGGVISDHLLISAVEEYEGPLPEFENLKKDDQKLIEALRTGGMIQMATWAPSDTCHIAQTSRSLVGHWFSKTPLDYSGPDHVYYVDAQGKLHVNEQHGTMEEAQPPFLSTLMKLPTAKYFIASTNSALRYISHKTDLQQRLSNREIPYALRIVGSRLLTKVSLYGLLKEIDASLHDSEGYQMRHLRALDIILKYDIPYLVIVHKDDFMVSANRHQEEHDYLLSSRMRKEGVTCEEDLKVPARLVLLEREGKEMAIDPLNPHLMLMSTSHEGDKLSREVTAAVTRFVNENVAAAIEQGKTKALASVVKWMDEHSK